MKKIIDSKMKQVQRTKIFVADMQQKQSHKVQRTVIFVVKTNTATGVDRCSVTKYLQLLKGIKN